MADSGSRRSEECLIGWPSTSAPKYPVGQFMFTIPKRLRIHFRFDRRLLGELCRTAARTVITVYRAANGLNGNDLRLPERGYPPARPRRGRLAKAGRRSSNSSTSRTRFAVPGAVPP